MIFNTIGMIMFELVKSQSFWQDLKKLAKNCSSYHLSKHAQWNLNKNGTEKKPKMADNGPKTGFLVF